MKPGDLVVYNGKFSLTFGLVLNLFVLPTIAVADQDKNKPRVWWSPLWNNGTIIQVPETRLELWVANIVL